MSSRGIAWLPTALLVLLPIVALGCWLGWAPGGRAPAAGSPTPVAAAAPAAAWTPPATSAADPGAVPLELPAAPAALPPQAAAAAATPAPRTIAGRVLGRDERPIPGAHVQLEIPAADGRAGRRLWMACDERGRFRFEPVPAGPARLRASADGYRLSPADEVASDDDERLLYLDPDTGVCGRLLAASGEPAAGPVAVRSLASGRTLAQTVADEHGRFCIGELEPGSYELFGVSGSHTRIDLARGGLGDVTLVLDTPPAPAPRTDTHQTMDPGLLDVWRLHAAGLIGPGDIDTP